MGWCAGRIGAAPRSDDFHVAGDTACFVQHRDSTRLDTGDELVLEHVPELADGALGVGLAEVVLVGMGGQGRPAGEQEPGEQ